MFQFRRFPTYDYFIHRRLTDLHLSGCPIRKSPDITPAYGSPRLIAVNHVLHRLPVPRHSPCALCSLTSFYLAFPLYSAEPLPRTDDFHYESSAAENSLCIKKGDDYAILLTTIELFHSIMKIVICYPFLFKILWLFKTVVIVSYLSFVLHYIVQFSRCDADFRLQTADVRHLQSLFS